MGVVSHNYVDKAYRGWVSSKSYFWKTSIAWKDNDLKIGQAMFHWANTPTKPAQSWTTQISEENNAK